MITNKQETLLLQCTVQFCAILVPESGDIFIATIKPV